MLGLRSKAPILPIFIVREEDNRHRIEICPQVILEGSGNRERDILLNTAKLTKIIEAYVRQYPSQWWWFHRRWRKTLPSK